MDLLNKVSSLCLSYCHDHCQWSIPPILQDSGYLLHVPSAAGLSFRSRYFKFFRVILYSWLCLLELTTPSTQKFLIIALLGLCSVLSNFPLSRIFWSMRGELVYVQHIRDSTAGSLSRTTSCHYGFQHSGILWVSSVLVHSLIEVLLIILPRQPTLYYSGRVKLLKFWQYSFISGHQISIIWHRQRIYIRQKCRDALVLS